MKYIWALVLLLGLADYLASAQTPSIDIYYPDGHARLGPGGRRPFEILTPQYQLTHNLTTGRFEALKLRAGPQATQNLFTNEAAGGITLQVVDGNGKLYSPIYANGSTQVATHNNVPVYDLQMLVHDGGEHFYQLELKTLRFKASDGTTLPMEASVRLNVWADRVLGEVTFTATSLLNISRMEIFTAFANGIFDRFRLASGNDTPIGAGVLVSDPLQRGIVLSNSNGNSVGSVAYILGDTNGTRHLQLINGLFGPLTNPALVCRQVLHDASLDGGNLQMNAGGTKAAYFHLFTSGQNASTSGFENLQAEISPLALSILGSSSGQATVSSYDPRKGFYRINMPSGPAPDLGGYRFSNLFQNDYDTVTLQLPASPIPRVDRIRIFQGSGLWGNAVVADEFGLPMGRSATVTRYIGLNTYHVLSVPANTVRRFMHKGVFTRWGHNPSYTVSTEDLTLFDPLGQFWLNAVNGLSGGTSYSPMQRIYSTFTDVGPINGNPKNKDVNEPYPQNIGGWEVLKYARADSPTTWREVEYRGWDYERNSPNLMSMIYRGVSEDGLISSRVEIHHPGYSDVTRQFVRLRYDVTGTVVLSSADGGIQRNLRLFSIGDEDYGQRDYPRYAYTDSAGTVRDFAWSQVTGVALGGPNPWVVNYPHAEGNRGLVLRKYTARINGQPSNTPAFTQRRVNGRNAGLWLVPSSSATQVIPGDFFDVELELVAYGTESSTTQPIQQEAARYGGTNFTIVPSTGTLLSAYPARVAVNGQEWTAFSLLNGVNFVPIEFSGFPNYTDAACKPPLLEERINNVWVPYQTSVRGRDGWETIQNPVTGKYGFLFSIWTQGEARTFRGSLSLNRLDCEMYEQALDSTPGNAGGQYRNDNVDVYASTSGGYYVGNTAAGEWLQWNHAPLGGGPCLATPQLYYRSAAGGSIRLTLNGIDQPSMVLPASVTWQNVNLPEVAINAANTVRVNILSGSPELDYLQMMYERPAPTLADDAVVVRHQLPTTLNQGETEAGWLEIKNVGTSAWTGASYGLEGLDIFGVNTFYALNAGESVPPGATRRFPFILTPPAVTTPYQYDMRVLRWRMRKAPGQSFGAEFKREIQTTALYGLATEALINPGFELGKANVPDAWRLSGLTNRVTVQPRTGSWCGRFLEPDEGNFYQSFKAIPFTRYRASAWFRSGTTPVEMATRILVYGRRSGNHLGGELVEHSNAVFGWTRQSVEFDAGINDLIQVEFQTLRYPAAPTAPDGEVFIDDTLIEVVTPAPTPTPTTTPTPTPSPSPSPTPLSNAVGGEAWVVY